MRIVAVIPARMGSSRFPGKPLFPIAGVPLVEHVRRRASLCRSFREVIVATCDREIAELVRQYGGQVRMTSPTHAAATDRVAEAVERLDCTHVVNVQGDEALVLPEDLSRLARAMQRSPEVPAWNAVAPLEGPQELSDRSVVKCLVSRSGKILFCSRDFSALLGAGNGRLPVRKVLGVLGFRRDFLRRYLKLARTPLEVWESVDQSRILEHDFVLRAVPFTRGYPGINLPQEVGQVEAILEREPLQRKMLRRVLEE